MATLKRVARIFKANVNSVLDSLEEPEKMIKQLLVEMRQALKDASVEAARARREEARLSAKLGECEHLALKWDENAVLALKNKDEELAKDALKRKMEYGRQAEELKGARDKQREMVKALESGLDELQKKLRELESKKSVLVSRKKLALAKKLTYETLREIEEQLEPAVLLDEAQTGLMGGELGKKFIRLSEEDDVEKELQSLKGRL